MLNLPTRYSPIQQQTMGLHIAHHQPKERSTISWRSIVFWFYVYSFDRLSRCIICAFSKRIYPMVTKKKHTQTHSTCIVIALDKLLTPSAERSPQNISHRRRIFICITNRFWLSHTYIFLLRFLVISYAVLPRCGYIILGLFRGLKILWYTFGFKFWCS